MLAIDSSTSSSTKDNNLNPPTTARPSFVAKYLSVVFPSPVHLPASECNIIGARLVIEEPKNSTEPVKDVVGAVWSAAAKRFASVLLPPLPLVTELIVGVRACCVTVTERGTGCVSELYGEGRATLTRFDAEGTCACGESTTTGPTVDVRGENRGKLSGSVEPCLIVVLPVVNPAGLEEMTCWAAIFNLLSFPGVGGIVVEMVSLMSTLNEPPTQISSLFSTSVMRPTLNSVGCRAPAARLTTVAVGAVNAERVGEGGRDDRRGL